MCITRCTVAKGRSSTQRNTLRKSVNNRFSYLTYCNTHPFMSEGRPGSWHDMLKLGGQGTEIRSWRTSSVSNACIGREDTCSAKTTSERGRLREDIRTRNNDCILTIKSITREHLITNFMYGLKCTVVAHHYWKFIQVWLVATRRKRWRRAC